MTDNHSSLMTLSEIVTQYTLGVFVISTGFVASGIDLVSSLPLSAILPALVLFLVNSPKMIHNFILLYRELKSGKTPGPSSLDEPVESGEPVE